MLVIDPKPEEILTVFADSNNMYKVHSTSDANDAYEKAQALLPDIILLDFETMLVYVYWV